MENYEYVKKLGSGNFGVISLMRHKHTGEMVAVKRLEVRSSPSRSILNVAQDKSVHFKFWTFIC